MPVVDEDRFGPAFLEDASPVLKQARDEIQAILDKHQIAGSVSLANSTHGEFWMSFPEWSAVRMGGTKGIHIKSNHEQDGPDHLSSSMHLLLCLRDCTTNHAGHLLCAGDAVQEMLKEHGIELEHKTIQQKMLEEGDVQ